MAKQLEVGEIIEKTLLIQQEQWIDDKFCPAVIVKNHFVWTGYKMIEVKPWQTPEQVSKIIVSWYENYSFSGRRTIKKEIK